MHTFFEDLRIGVIGAGARSRFVDAAHQPGKGARVVAGADVHPTALERFVGRYEGAAAYRDYRRMFDEAALDAVFIASPDYLHEEHAVAALERGIAVYLEKPMAISIAACDRIIQAASDHDAKLYVGHNMRHMPFVQEMKKVIDSGRIGEVKAAWCRHFIAYGGDAYFKDWHSEKRYVNSLLLQKAVHDIDVMHWLCGGFTERVVAMGALTVYGGLEGRRTAEDRPDASWSDEHWPPGKQQGLSPVIDVEDLNHVLLELNTGVLMTYQQCHYTPDAWRNYTIIGTQGRIENIGDEPGRCEIRVWDRRTSFSERGDQQIMIPEMEGGHGGADPLIINEFLGYVRGECQPTTCSLAARAAVAAAAQAAESLRHGSRPQVVPPYKARPSQSPATAGAAPLPTP